MQNLRLKKPFWVNFRGRLKFVAFVIFSGVFCSCLSILCRKSEVSVRRLQRLGPPIYSTHSTADFGHRSCYSHTLWSTQAHSTSSGDFRRLRMSNISMQLAAIMFYTSYLSRDNSTLRRYVNDNAQSRKCLSNFRSKLI